MPRRAVPAAMIDTKKSHRSKDEIEHRKAWEDALESGEGMRMTNDVRSDPYARELFKYLKKTFASVGMDDALYGEGMNGYCLIKSDLRKQIAERDKLMAADDIDSADKYNLLVKMNACISKLRDQTMVWEKENLGTVQAKLRAIPKKPQKEEADNVTGIAAFMRRQG